MPDTSDKNRREFFRFQVNESCLFRIAFKNKDATSSWGRCNVLEMSGGGARVMTALSLPTEHATLLCELNIQFDREFTLQGELVWTDYNKLEKAYYYGLKWWGLDDVTREELIKSLVHKEMERKKKRLG